MKRGGKRLLVALDAMRRNSKRTWTTAEINAVIERARKRREQSKEVLGKQFMELIDRIRSKSKLRLTEKEINAILDKHRPPVRKWSAEETAEIERLHKEAVAKRAAHLTTSPNKTRQNRKK